MKSSLDLCTLLKFLGGPGPHHTRPPTSAVSLETSQLVGECSFQTTIRLPTRRELEKTSPENYKNSLQQDQQEVRRQFRHLSSFSAVCLNQFAKSSSPKAGFPD